MTEPLLEVRGLAIRFGGIKAARGIDLSVAAGERLAIIGQNGAGKSTFLNICTGYLRPQAGNVTLAGRPIVGLAPRSIARAGIARAFQHPEVFAKYTVRENLRFAVAAHRGFWRPLLPIDARSFSTAAEELISLFALERIADQAVGGTAQGVRKLVDIAMAFALRPRLLMLDEPTSGVSTAEKYPLMDVLVTALAAQKITAVFVEHDLDVVTRYADRVAVWSEGKVIATGPPANILSDPAIRARI